MLSSEDRSLELKRWDKAIKAVLADEANLCKDEVPFPSNKECFLDTFSIP